ncbi:MAG: hypothetical protein IJZ30_07280 [Alphaproteobacteria bacterium]|nr:hypothetical protein [Alphaproteobacteria bacterium]
MTVKTSHKVSLFVLLVVTAVVLCTLPFILSSFDDIYVFTKNKYPSSEERGFIQELKKTGYKVYVNNEKIDKSKIAIWFKSANDIRGIMDKTIFEHNFVYAEEYYPYDWENLKKHPIVLTPHQKLYEHYMRLNIKSATFTLGANLSEFYPLAMSKKYNIVYYEQRQANTLLSEYLKTFDNVYFLGRFWKSGVKGDASSEDIAKNDNKILSQAKIVIIDNYETNNIIPREIINATASRSLVLTPKNNAVYEIYGDSLVYYNNFNDIMPLVSYYTKMTDIATQKANKAWQITSNNLSSSNSVKRFNELYEWIKNN